MTTPAALAPSRRSLWEQRPEGFALFVGVVTVAQASLLVPSWPQKPGWALAATVVFAWSIAAALVLIRTDRRAWLAAVPAYSFMAVVALWREADGGAASGFAPMLGVAVLWLALHGSRVQVWLSVLGVALIMLGPILLVGAPDYPVSDLRRAVLWVLLAALLGPVTHKVVQERAALEPARARLDGLLEAATGHSVVATDLDGVVTVFSTGAERLFGRRAADVEGRVRLVDLLDGDELDRLATERGAASRLEGLTHVARAGGTETRDWTWVGAHGERVPVSASTSAVRDADGRVTGYITIATDQTAQHAALDELREREELWRLLVESLPATTVGLLDEHLAWIAVSGPYLAQAGSTSASLTGRLAGGTLADDGTRARVRGLLDRGRTAAVSEVVEVQPGIWLEIDALPVHGSGSRVLVVARDVSERQRQQEEREALLTAVAAEERRFRALFEDAPTGVVLSPGPGAPAGGTVEVNRAFARLLGTEDGRVPGGSLLPLVHPEDRDVARAAWSGAEHGTFQARLRHVSGRYLWTEVHHTPVATAGAEADVVLSQVVDVTTRHAAERALLEALEQQRAAAEALREADAVRTDVMASVSHELRTPLTSIRGYVEVLADEATGLTEEERAMLDVVGRNAQALMSLVDDLVVLSRLDDPGATSALRQVRVDVGSAVHAAARTVLPSVQARAQDLVVAVDAAAEVLVDPEHLDRALLNLLSNAVKYTPERGRLRLVVTTHRDTVDIAVGDEGEGIKAHELNRLFTRFFRTESAQRSGVPGTGLGLAITKSLVELNQGRIKVRSTPGIGSTFVITLPRHHGRSAGAVLDTSSRGEEA